MRQPAAVLLALTAALRCTPSDLVPVPEDEAVSDRVSVRGDVCTHAPAPYAPETRLLFSVDSSDSMLRNDPSNLVVDAMEHVVAEFGAEGTVEFGMLRWGERVIRELAHCGSDPLVVPELFTNDAAVLGEAFGRLRQLVLDNPDRYLGGTDYELALTETEKYVQEDLARHPEHYSEAHYVIIFITDGMPQSGDSDPQTTRDNIIMQVDTLVRRYGATFATAYLGEETTIPEQFLNLLPDMAQHGAGAHVQVATSDGLMGAFDDMLRNLVDLFLFDLARLRVDENRKSVLVSNDNVRIVEVNGVIDQYVDSDADGLVDKAELDVHGSDPTKADADGDGLDDFFEVAFLGEFDPRIRRSPALTAEERSDEDGDGLSLFVESRIGTDPTRPDTDADGLVDGVEFRAGTDYMAGDVSKDYDRDGVPNGTEIMEHTNPTLDEGEELRRDEHYAIASIGEPVRNHNGRRCYEFLVANIKLMETLPATDPLGIETPLGFNHISVMWLETPTREDISEVMRARLPSPFSKGVPWIIFRPSEKLRDPPALELSMRGGLQ